MFNFNCKSDYTLLKSVMDCKKIAKFSKKLGYSAACLMDNGTVSGFMEFIESCKSEKIKPILGVTVDAIGGTLSIVAKNLQGAKKLFRLISLQNKNGTLTVDQIAEFNSDDWLVFSGYPGSTLYKDNRQFIKEELDNLNTLFGKNWYIAIYRMAKCNKLDKINQILMEESPKEKHVAWFHSRYAEPDDGADLRVLLSSFLGKTLLKVRPHITPSLAPFFDSDDYYMPTIEEIQQKYLINEIDNCIKLGESCESYSLEQNPQLPEFTKGIDAYEELANIAREGWRTLLNWPKDSPKYKEYGDRIRYELGVIKENNLANYFLIVADICRYARENNIVIGPGRGSSAGCLISYLIGITQVDPVKHGLLFERFFNPSRKNSLPDIDLDFQPSKREQIIQYIIDKYGSDSVAKISTFGRLQGKAILKEVLRVHEACDFSTMNEITSFIPDESRISGELQELSEENEEYAKILYWTLKNNKKELSPWVTLEDDGSLSGEFAKYFEQAMRLEGLYKQIGEHASGVIIAPGMLDDFCPLIKSSKGKILAGMPFPYLEKLGLCKIDILGVSVYDKLAMIIQAMRTGDIYNDGDNCVSDLSENTESISVCHI